MIEDTLKQHKAGDKPRFFLHDEMKAWLYDNLKVTVNHGINASVDYDLQSKLGLPHSLIAGFNLLVSTSIAGETISLETVQINLVDHEKAFKTLANVSEQCMVHINRLLNEVQILQQRIQELENK